MPLIPAGAVRLHVNRWDGDPARVPFLLVHGLASNARMWDGVGERLADLGHPAAAVDLRGHGRSDKPDDGYDVATVAADLTELIRALGFDRPVAAGQSWGGNVVLEVGARHPDLVRGVVPVDGGTIELSSHFTSWEECAAALAPPRTQGTPLDQIAGFMRRLHPDWPESGITGALANFEVREDGTVAPWLSFERHMLVLRGLYDHHPADLFADMQVPVLFIPAETAASSLRGGALRSAPAVASGDAPPDPPGHQAHSWTADKRASVEGALALLPRGRVHWIAGDHDIHAQRPHEVAAVLHAAVEDGFFS